MRWSRAMIWFMDRSSMDKVHGCRFESYRAGQTGAPTRTTETHQIQAWVLGLPRRRRVPRRSSAVGQCWC